MGKCDGCGYFGDIAWEVYIRVDQCEETTSRGGVWDIWVPTSSGGIICVIIYDFIFEKLIHNVTCVFVLKEYE